MRRTVKHALTGDARAILAGGYENGFYTPEDQPHPVREPHSSGWRKINRAAASLLAFPESRLSLWERFTEQARRSIAHAQAEAETCGQQQLLPIHLLAGILQEEQSAASRVLDYLARHDLQSPYRSRNALREALTDLLVSDGIPDTNQEMSLSPAAFRILEAARHLARSLSIGPDGFKIGTEHILLALLTDSGPAGQLLRDRGVAYPAVVEAISSGFVSEAISGRVATLPPRQEARPGEALSRALALVFLLFLILSLLRSCALCLDCSKPSGPATRVAEPDTSFSKV